MTDFTGCIVRADAGRDRDGIFVVTGVDEERHMLLLADGKRRKVARPKPKKPGHVTVLTDSEHLYGHPAIRKIKEREPVSDRELRRALAAFKEEGYTLGERRYD